MWASICAASVVIIFPGVHRSGRLDRQGYPWSLFHRRITESLVDRMPVVRSIYSGIKQISETVFAQTETIF